MTGTEIKTMFEAMVDDTIDSTLAFQLMNVAKDKIEAERDWQFLKKLDSSLSASSASKALPSDYGRTMAIYVNNQLYQEIPFEEQRLQANGALKWYLDLANSVFYLLGSNLSGTIYHFYIRKTDDIAAATSPVWPSRFHSLVAFEMAENYFAVDQGDRGRSWDDKFSRQRELMRRAMVTWDASLQRRSMENVTPMDADTSYPLGLM